MSAFDQLSNKSFFKAFVRQGLMDSSDKGSSQRTITIGIVATIDRYGGKWTILGKPSSPYTIQAFVPEADTDTDIDSMNYYEPFLPIHMMAIPELKEEVIIIYDSPKRSKGWWVSRNDAKKLTKTSANEGLVPDTASDKERFGDRITSGGQDYNFSETDVAPNKDKQIPMWRKKPGDVFHEGRSNTLVVHTFDQKNQEGIIDVVTERTGNLVNTSDLSSIKDKEFQDTTGSRIMVTTKHNVDKNNDWDLTTTPGFKYSEQTQSSNQNADKNDHTDRAYVFEMADEYRFVSRLSSEKLNNGLLANNFEVWMCSFIDALQQMIDTISQMQIVTVKGQPNEVNLMTGGLKAVRTKLEQMKKTQNQFHSKHFFFN